MKRSHLCLALACLTAACGREPAPTSARVRLPIAYSAGGEEELIGMRLYGLSAYDAQNLVFHAWGSGPGGSINGYFTSNQTNNRWGLYIVGGGCPTNSEVHWQNSARTLLGPTEEHCGYDGPYDVTVTGGGYDWTRSIAMLDSAGILDDVTRGVYYQDVKVTFDATTPSTTLSGSLRGDTSYVQNDTTAFSTSGATIRTGHPVWFVSTYQSYAGGTLKYDYTDVLNSYNFSYPDGEWQPAVNSVWQIPFRHVYRSPGRITRYVTRLRVVEPYHAGMGDGRLMSDSLVYLVTADSACWTSPGGFAYASVSFSASCSDTLNNGVAEYQWVWSSAAGDTSAWSTSTSATHVFTTSGTKTVKLRIRLNTGEGGMDSTAHTVTITDPPPSVEYNLAPTPVKPQRYCTWSVFVSGGTAPVSVRWRKNTDQTTLGTDTSITLYTGTTSFRLWAIATDAASQKDSVSMWVSVYSGSFSNCTI